MTTSTQEDGDLVTDLGMQIDPVAGIVDWLRNTQSNLDGDGASKERRYALAADEIERLRTQVNGLSDAVKASIHESSTLRSRVERLEGALTDAQQRRDKLKVHMEDMWPQILVEQKHLSEHTPEQAYWHFGYYAALGDVIAKSEIRAALSQARGGE
jgi:chromosome segregation ATPase